MLVTAACVHFKQVEAFHLLAWGRVLGKFVTRVVYQILVVQTGYTHQCNENAGIDSCCTNDALLTRDVLWQEGCLGHPEHVGSGPAELPVRIRTHEDGTAHVCEKTFAFTPCQEHSEALLASCVIASRPCDIRACEMTTFLSASAI